MIDKEIEDLNSQVDNMQPPNFRLTGFFPLKLYRRVEIEAHLLDTLDRKSYKEIEINIGGPIIITTPDERWLAIRKKILDKASEPAYTSFDFSSLDFGNDFLNYLSFLENFLLCQKGKIKSDQLPQIKKQDAFRHLEDEVIARLVDLYASLTDDCDLRYIVLENFDRYKQFLTLLNDKQVTKLRLPHNFFSEEEIDQSYQPLCEQLKKTLKQLSLLEELDLSELELPLSKETFLESLKENQKLKRLILPRFRIQSNSSVPGNFQLLLNSLPRLEHIDFSFMGKILSSKHLPFKYFEQWLRVVTFLKSITIPVAIMNLEEQETLDDMELLKKNVGVFLSTLPMANSLSVIYLTWDKGYRCLYRSSSKDIQHPDIDDVTSLYTVYTHQEYSGRYLLQSFPSNRKPGILQKANLPENTYFSLFPLELLKKINDYVDYEAAQHLTPNKLLIAKKVRLFLETLKSKLEERHGTLMLINKTEGGFFNNIKSAANTAAGFFTNDLKLANRIFAVVNKPYNVLCWYSRLTKLENICLEAVADTTNSPQTKDFYADLKKRTENLRLELQELDAQHCEIKSLTSAT